MRDLVFALENVQGSSPRGQVESMVHVRARKKQRLWSEVSIEPSAENLRLAWYGLPPSQGVYVLLML